MTRRRPRLADSGVALTPRDIALLESLWWMRCATRLQLQRLHFTPKSMAMHRHGGLQAERRGVSPELAPSSICIRRLGLLRVHGYLSARRRPLASGGGATPFVYAIGPRAVSLLAERLDVEAAVVAQRQRQDSRLSWLFYEHRAALTDLHIAFQIAALERGATLEWQGDEEVAAAALSVVVDGKRLPVRPDAVGAVSLREGGRASFFIEVQRTSRPSVFRRKALAHAAFWAGGSYEQQFRSRSLRVLTVVESDHQRDHLKAAVTGAEPARMFWFGLQQEVVTAPFGPVWSVAGMEGKYGLLDGAQQRQAVAVATGG